MNKRDQLYMQLLEASKQQIEENISAHKLSSGQIRSSFAQQQALLRTNKQAPPPQMPLDFLAIGDSWFEYPLFDDTISFNNAIVAPMQLGSMGNPPPHVLNQALHGQLMKTMLSPENREKIIAVLKDRDQWLDEQTGLPDAILVSAGGNDLVVPEYQLATYLNRGGGGLNIKRFQEALHSLHALYMDLFALRDQHAKGVPIVAHCYDYAIPNGVHPICVRSAWLWPSLSLTGHDYNAGLHVLTQMMNLFHDMLAALARSPANHFHLIDTRNTLARDASQPLGWANEIHPWHHGFTALATKFLAGLRAMPAFMHRI
jgi:hypothetical protein